MKDEILKDEDYGTRDKRGHWKPFGTIAVNPPHVYPFKPIKLLKHIVVRNFYKQ